MADFFLGKLPIVAGNANFPLIGAWTAEVLLSGTDAPPVGTKTTLIMRGTERACAVVSSSADYLQVKCRLVAGAGKLDVPLDARDYRNYAASTIAQDALKDAGEAVGDWSALTTVCPHWLRPQGPLRETLHRLVRLTNDPDLHWRVGDDGRVSLVRDLYTLATPNEETADLGSWGAERLLLFGVTDTSIQPGRSVVAFDQTRQIDRCLYEWDADKFQCLAWYRRV